METTPAQTFSGNVITQAINCDPNPLEVTSSGEMLPETYQSSLPLILSADTGDQASAAKSPRLSIPLSALTGMTPPNQVSLANAVIDLQQLQAFLMTLQPQLNQTSGANFESSSSADDAATLTTYPGALPCSIEGEATGESESSASVSTGLMTINDSFTSRPLESFDPLGKANEEIVLSPRELFGYLMFSLQFLPICNYVFIFQQSLSLSIWNSGGLRGRGGGLRITLGITIWIGIKRSKVSSNFRHSQKLSTKNGKKYLQLKLGMVSLGSCSDYR